MSFTRRIAASHKVNSYSDKEAVNMNIRSVLLQTPVIQHDRLVRDVFLECGRCHVQALPYGDANGRIYGRVTIKHILLASCLPSYLVEMAPILGESLSCLDNVEEKIKLVLCKTVEPFVQELPMTINSEASLIKALAIMEKHDTSYIFVVDEGIYQGVITIQGIAAKMSELDTCAAVYDGLKQHAGSMEGDVPAIPRWRDER